MALNRLVSLNFTLGVVGMCHCLSTRAQIDQDPKVLN